MAWSNLQKTTAIMACRAAGITDEHRRLILRQFNHAMYDAAGKKTKQPSSTSRRLTNADFEHFMAVIERSAGGQLTVNSKAYPIAHWQSKADDALSRTRWKAQRIADALADAAIFDRQGASLAGWISKRVTAGETDRLAALDYHQLNALITDLSAFAKGRGVTIKEGGVRHAG